jgi:hypothetical protein
LEDRGPRCTLLAFIDDATGRLQYARFVGAETTRGYLHALRDYVSRYGRPVAIYSDRHSIFTKHDPEDPTPTQFERALRQLDIEPILALSPQAKGRVERAFQTLQDRLVKALRLANVSTMEDANALLPRFVKHDNARFGKPAQSPDDAHRPAAMSDEALRMATCELYPRRLSKSLSCQSRGRLYLVQTGGEAAYPLRKAPIIVCDDGRDDTVVLLYKNKPLPYRLFERHDLPLRVADDKTLNDRVDQAKGKQAKKPWIPPANHPWRNPHINTPCRAPA